MFVERRSLTISLTFKEYAGFKIRDALSFKEFAYDASAAVPTHCPDTAVLADIEGIHEYPVVTRNCTRYMPQALKESVAKWTSPYYRPLIKHHNEENGETIGRVIAANYKESKIVPGTHALEFTVVVPKEPHASDVESGLLDTVSIGFTTNDMRCSICGQNIAQDGPCEHERGLEYDGQTCYWDCYQMDPKELSYVIVPSDPYAKNVRVYKKGDVVPPAPKPLSIAASAGKKMNESYNLNGGKLLNEEEIKALQEKVADLELKLSDAAEKLDDAIKSNDELKASVAEKDEQLKIAEEETAAKLEQKESELSALSEAKELAEAGQKEAETKLLEQTESYRTLLAQSVNFARKVSGLKEISEAALTARSVDSLKDSWMDVTESYAPVEPQQKQVDQVEPKVIDDPTIQKKQNVPVTESVNTKDALRDLLYSATR